MGFSTGTALSAGARAALRYLLTGLKPKVIAVRLPGGSYLPIPIQEVQMGSGYASAMVLKNAGDDPDVTHRAKIRVKVKCIKNVPDPLFHVVPSILFDPINGKSFSGIILRAGEGVGRVTKPGLPVAVGEPAINPVPRTMLVQNLEEELAEKGKKISRLKRDELNDILGLDQLEGPLVALPFNGRYEEYKNTILEVEVEMPDGMRLAERTLNPRLGITGGLSILGTNGLVKPFSHEAYTETIRSALSVALSSGCREVVLSTGGKSERFARKILSDWPIEAFVQIADYYGFSLSEVVGMGFSGVVHSLFFGKLVKIAQGSSYTHAHKVRLDLDELVQIALDRGYDANFAKDLRSANTARHAFDILVEKKALDVIGVIARKALQNTVRRTEGKLKVRLLLFDFNGNLVVDISR